MNDDRAQEKPVPPGEKAMLAWIHHHAPYGVITTDEKLRIQSWNQWMEAHSGKGSSSVIGQELLDLFPDLKRRGLEKRFQRALEGEISLLSSALHGYLLPIPPLVRDAGFEHMQQTARIGPLLYGPEIIGCIIVIEDVTEREIQASTLRRQHERDHILSWALAHLLEAQEPHRSIRDLFFKVAERFDFDAYLLYLREPGKENLKLQAAGGLSPAEEQLLGSIGLETPLGARILSLPGACAYEALGPDQSPVEELSRPLGFRACALLSLTTAKGFRGALLFGTRSRASLQEGELQLLSTIGKYLALALEKEATSFELTSAQASLNLHAQELEKQVAERTANLRDIIGELETFSYTLAHDLRAPIRALIGYSDALIEDYSQIIPDDGKSVLARLRRACKQLDGLTKDLLEYSKVSRQDIQLSTVDLELLVAEAISLAPPAYASIDVRRPLHRVLAHRSSLQQCLSNLIDNAFKFSKEGHKPVVRLWTEVRPARSAGSIGLRDVPAGSGQPPESPVAVTPQSLREKALKAVPRIRIVVADEGIGIPVEAHRKIFGIFERGSSSPKHEGSGIGLAIVARAIQRMGGTCGVESQPGQGSRFWLELPEG
jgi:signal transduction histidine kinase